MPGDWLKSVYPEEQQMKAVLDRHDLGTVPETPAEFMAFFNLRRERLRERLTEMLVRQTDALALDAATQQPDAAPA